jgi:signal transduction histidine kinase
MANKRRYPDAGGRQGSVKRPARRKSAKLPVRATKPRDAATPAVPPDDAVRIRALGELALAIAHDVNNVLAALRLRVGILLKDATCMTSQSPNLFAMQRILNEGTALLLKLQNFDRAEPPAITPVDLQETIRAAVEIAQSGLRRRAVETGVQVRIRCELDALPKVHALAEDLRHVFVNVLINARDAMVDGGTITVRGHTDGGAVVVTVEDEGPGILPIHLPRIFDPQFTTKGSKGTGMGLATARTVMERIGGSISARNRAAGGACFELRFSPIREGRSVSVPVEETSLLQGAMKIRRRPAANPATHSERRGTLTSARSTVREVDRSG